MIERYSLPEMSRLWTDENRFRQMLDVELAVVQAQARSGLIPRKSAAGIQKKADFDIDEIRRIEKITKHDVTAFLESIARRVGKDARFIHMGLTSSDVLDTGLSLQIAQGLDLVLRKSKELQRVIKGLALRHKFTPIMGRTHGIHAEPTTFGLKLLIFYKELGRNIERLNRARAVISVGKISGAVGTYATLSPAIERIALRRLGLRPAPVSNQVLQRDRHAEVILGLAILGSSLEKLATEIRHLQRTEVHEVEEAFTEGQTGSSAMPHKKNPVNCERVVGLARLLRAHSIAALENIALWHERDISHSSVERVIIPDSFLVIDFMLTEMIRILKTLVIYPQTMLANIAKTRGLVFSQRLLLALVEKGMSRQKAYRLVQRLSLKVWQNEALDLKTLVRLDPKLKRFFTAAEVERIFNLDAYLKFVNAIFRRAL